MVSLVIEIISYMPGTSYIIARYGYYTPSSPHIIVYPHSLLFVLCRFYGPVCIPRHTLPCNILPSRTQAELMMSNVKNTDPDGLPKGLVL